MKSFLLGALGALTVIAAFEAGRYARTRTSAAQWLSPAPKYSLHEFRDKYLAGITGVENNRLLKINEGTGETWELVSWDVPIGLVTENGTNGTQRVTGWDLVAPDYNQAVQEAWQKFGTPAPKKK